MKLGLGAASVIIGTGLWWVFLSSGQAQVTGPPEPLLANVGSPVAVDPLAEVARQYAPFIYHATDPTGGRQDLISNIDFDGDYIGHNNWENFAKYELQPTVYYAVLETETHYFIAYHLFHPRDWNHFTVWLNDTHENDGENLQVVVRKRDGRVVLLWTQAHYRSAVYTSAEAGIESGATKIKGPLLTVDSAGHPNAAGPHAAVFVEAEGHGIYGALASHSEVQVANDGQYHFKNRSGLLFRPARAGASVREPAITTAGEVPYQLDSITLKLWPALRAGRLTGNGQLLDGACSYQDDLVNVREVPRFYDANRFSGPLGSDRGISPFALDFSFQQGTLGALFFNPAKRYAERLKINEPWSRQYLDYPFGDQN